jgi:hypothetical protein
MSVPVQTWSGRSGSSETLGIQSPRNGITIHHRYAAYPDGSLP